MRRLTCTTLLALTAAVSLVGSSEAQSTTAARALPATDSVFKRARRLVADGDGAAGRALVDSMLRAAQEGTAGFGDALYWRGALAETAADAERDYRRVIVEYPLSPYADDALLSLAELEQARGDRAAAYQHLQRFVREHAPGPARARAGLAAARLAFEQRDVPRGCAMIADARSSVGTSDVELRNQIEYHGSRCATTSASAPATAAPATGTTSTARPSTRIVTTNPGPTQAPAPRPATTTPTSAPSRAPTAAPAAPAAASRADTSDSPTTPTTTPKSETAVRAPAAKEPVSRGIWTIQLAAYNTRADAEQLVRKLAARDVKARISGDAKPFRVRLDYYQTRQKAAERVAELKQRGIIGFVTDEPRTTGAGRP
jgi:cell division septation protein DedD